MNPDCAKTRERLTAYLDGELDPDVGTVVRGHLRTCDGCRDSATAEAALRDGLRALPSLDPPASLWEGVQARLAAAEVEAAEQPGWRRALGKLSAWSRGTGVLAPRVVVPGLALAAVVTVMIWRARHTDEAVLTRQPGAGVIAVPSPEIAPDRYEQPPVEIVPAAPFGTDVTADLASEGQRVVGTYASTAEELLALVAEVRTTWPEADQQTFDREVAVLQDAVNAADGDRAKQKSLRALIRYVQRALVRDEVALAGGGGL